MKGKIKGSGKMSSTKAGAGSTGGQSKTSMVSNPNPAAQNM